MIHFKQLVDGVFFSLKGVQLLKIEEEEVDFRVFNDSFVLVKKNILKVE